jgi:hypothetical protein
LAMTNEVSEVDDGLSEVSKAVRKWGRMPVLFGLHAV